MKTTKPRIQSSMGANSSFTADGVAYRRTHTDIPYSQEIWDIFSRISGPLDPREKERADGYPQIVPLFESRYKLTDQIIQESKITQVVELASGLSPRGYAFARDPRYRFIEFDLPEKIAIKRQVLEELARSENTTIPQHLMLSECNVSEPLSISTVVNMAFPHGPICFVAEGLLRYLSWDDKAMLTKTIRELLSRPGGGIWVTPDIEPLEMIQGSPEAMARYDRMAEEWGYDVRPNLFQTFGHAVEFFQGFDFDISVRPHSGVIHQLTSPAKLGLPMPIVKKQLDNWLTYILKV